MEDFSAAVASVRRDSPSHRLAVSDAADLGGATHPLDGPLDGPSVGLMSLGDKGVGGLAVRAVLNIGGDEDVVRQGGGLGLADDLPELL